MESQQALPGINEIKSQLNDLKRKEDQLMDALLSAVTLKLKQRYGEDFNDASWLSIPLQLIQFAAGDVEGIYSIPKAKVIFEEDGVQIMANEGDWIPCFRNGELSNYLDADGVQISRLEKLKTDLEDVEEKEAKIIKAIESHRKELRFDFKHEEIKLKRLSNELKFIRGKQEYCLEAIRMEVEGILFPDTIFYDPFNASQDVQWLNKELKIIQFSDSAFGFLTCIGLYSVLLDKVIYQKRLPEGSKLKASEKPYKIKADKSNAVISIVGPEGGMHIDVTGKEIFF